MAPRRPAAPPATRTQRNAIFSVTCNFPRDTLVAPHCRFRSTLDPARRDSTYPTVVGFRNRFLIFSRNPLLSGINIAPRNARRSCTPFSLFPRFFSFFFFSFIHFQRTSRLAFQFYGLIKSRSGLFISRYREGI